MEFSYTEINLGIFIGMFLSLLGVLNLVKRQSRVIWPKVEGRIIVSSVSRENPKTELLGSDYFPTTIKGGAKSYFLPWFKYEYVVENKKYISHRMYSAPLSWLKISDVRKFNSDEKVLVHYKPIDPEKAFILHSPIWFSLFLTGIGILMWVALFFKL